MVARSPGFESGVSPAHSCQPISWWVATWDGTWLRADLCEGQQRKKITKKEPLVHQKHTKKKKEVKICLKTFVQGTVREHYNCIGLGLNWAREILTLSLTTLFVSLVSLR